jgi:acyl-CoA thioester hydrolase
METRDSAFSVRLRARYQETDGMGVVYHANYLTWMEIARTEWTRAKGMAYHSVEAMGYYMPVVDVSIQYKHPARYDQEVDVYTWVEEMSGLKMSFGYSIRSAEAPDTVFAAARSMHVWVDKDWRPTRLSKAAPELYETLERAVREGR